VIRDRIRTLKVACTRQILNVYTHMYLCKSWCTVGLYVQEYQGQRVLKGLNNSFKVDQLAFTASKIITNMVFIYIYIFCFLWHRNIMCCIPTECEFARRCLSVFGRHLQS